MSLMVVLLMLPLMLPLVVAAFTSCVFRSGLSPGLRRLIRELYLIFRRINDGLTQLT